jgi:hypothetical protein
MSYLRGPLTRDQIRELMGGRLAAGPRAPEPSAMAAAVEAPRQAAPAAVVRPIGRPTAGPPRWVLPPEIPQFFLPAPGAASYSPMLLGAARVRYADSKTGADETRDIVVVTPFGEGAAGVDWAESADAQFSLGDLSRDMPGEAALEDLPADAQRPRRYQEWTRSFASWIARERKLPLFRNASLRLVSNPGENEAAFRLRLQQAAREKRDTEVDRLRSRYAPKAAALEERLRRAKQSVAREEQQASQSGVQTAISFGATLLGAVLGRKVLSGSNVGRATTAARSAGRAMKEKEDIGRAKETVAAVEARIAELEASLAEDVAALEASYDLRDAPLETITLTPKRGHIEVQTVALVWLPR